MSAIPAGTAPALWRRYSSKNGFSDASGARRSVSADLLDDLEIGDYVMVHAGVAIAKITDDDASETEKIMEEL